MVERPDDHHEVQGLPQRPPNVIILCCPRIERQGLRFVEDPNDRRTRWSPHLRGRVFDEEWCCIRCDSVYDIAPWAWASCPSTCDTHGQRFLLVDMLVPSTTPDVARYVCAQAIDGDVAIPLITAACPEITVCYVHDEEMMPPLIADSDEQEAGLGDDDVLPAGAVGLGDDDVLPAGAVRNRPTRWRSGALAQRETEETLQEQLRAIGRRAGIIEELSELEHVLARAEHL